MKLKKLLALLIFTAVALGLRLLERLIPLPIALAGDTLGLANLITVVAVFLMKWDDAAVVLALRVSVASLWLGFAEFLFSAGGGLCAFAVAVGLKKLLPESQIWIAGVLAAISHSAGQLLVAAALRQTPYLLLYAPVLLVFSLGIGLVMGLCAQFLVRRGSMLWKTVLE